MTNPNNAIGTNGAYGGRTSVEALNDVLNIFDGGGVVRGWTCSPSSGMVVSLGGVTGHRDVAIAVSPTGARTTINNRLGSAVNVTIDTAPSTNSRIDSIVAYAQNPPQGSNTVVDNPSACGIISVKGSVSSSPSAPDDATIRSAITADGATGSTAYYVVLAQVRVVAGLTTITSNYITQGDRASVGSSAITNRAITSDKIDWSTMNIGISTNSSLSFTAPTAGKLLLIGSANNTWGYSGGSIRIGYIKSSGSASLDTIGSTVIDGGNLVGRSAQTMAISNMSKNQSITVTIGKISGANLGHTLDDFMHFYVFIPN